MFRSLFDIVERQRDLKEEDRIALLEQWKTTGAKPEITGWWNQNFTVKTSEELAEVIRAIPVGGAANIFLFKDVVYELSSSIDVVRKYLAFKPTGSGTNNPKIVAKSLVKEILGSDRNTTYHFNLTASTIFAWNIDFEVEEAQDSSLSIWPHSSMFYGTYGISSINLVNSNITLPNTSYFGLADSDGWASQVALNLTNCTIDTAGAYALYITNGGMAVYLEANCSYSDDTKKISGIVKDSNGVPRNVVSNVTL